MAALARRGPAAAGDVSTTAATVAGYSTTAPPWAGSPAHPPGPRPARRDRDQRPLHQRRPGRGAAEVPLGITVVGRLHSARCSREVSARSSGVLGKISKAEGDHATSALTASIISRPAGALSDPAPARVVSDPGSTRAGHEPSGRARRCRDPFRAPTTFAERRDTPPLFRRSRHAPACSYLPIPEPYPSTSPRTRRCRCRTSRGSSLASR